MPHPTNGTGAELWLGASSPLASMCARRCVSRREPARPWGLCGSHAYCSRIGDADLSRLTLGIDAVLHLWGFLPLGTW